MPKYKYQNITISGLPGAGASTLGKKLAKVINWKYFSGGDFMRAYAIKKDLFDKNKSVHHDATVYSDDFDRKVDMSMRNTLKNKSGHIIESWLSGFISQGVEGTFKILVNISHDSVRIDRIANRDRISIEEAKNHIFERKKKNLTKWKRMYKKEWNKWIVDRGVMKRSEKIDFWNPKLYDLVIDTYSHSREETLKLALKALKHIK